MQVDGKAERPVDQANLGIIAQILQGRYKQFGTSDLPKATFIFGPEDGVRRSFIVTPSFQNPSRLDAVYYAIPTQGKLDRMAIEAAWITAINAEQGSITFANDIGQTMSMNREGQVSFEGPVNTGS